MSEHALEDLSKFLLLAKTTKGAATAALVREVLEHPNVYVFGELLALPNVQEVRERAARRPHPPIRPPTPPRTHAASLVPRRAAPLRAEARAPRIMHA